MLKKLIESGPRARDPGRTHWGAASVAVHAILIAAAVAGTTGAVHSRVDQPRSDTIIYVPVTPRPAAPTRPAAPAPVITGPVISVPSRPVIQPTFNCDPGTAFSIDSLLASLPGDTAGTGDPAAPGTPTDGVYDATAVDRAVTPRAGNPQPLYPNQLRSAGIEGTVVARFVVDTLGRVEPRSIDIISATHNLFTESVRDALQRSRFVPAQYGRFAVRQLVEQRFSFALTR